MLLHVSLLLLGVLCAAVGGELFVRGAVGIARWLRVAPGIIGATVAAFATSSPELSVSVQASLAGTPRISLGDALGSNIVNIALILGLALAFSPIRVPRDTFRREIPLALSVAVAVPLLLLDGMLSRLEGCLLLAVFLAWVVWLVVAARTQRDAAGGILGAGTLRIILPSLAAGLALLVAAGTLVVAGAEGIALRYGVSEFVIGATIVALGTSMPELATTLISKLRGHDEVGLGTVLGSNIFNCLFVVGVAAVICPIRADFREVAAAGAFGLAAIASIWPGKSGRLGRGRGIVLLFLYGLYATVVAVGRAG